MTSPAHLNEDVRFQLGNISGKLDLIMAHNADTDRRNTERFSGIEDQISEHDGRLDQLEQNQSRVIGAGAALAGLFGAVATIIGLRS